MRPPIGTLRWIAPAMIIAVLVAGVRSGRAARPRGPGFRAVDSGSVAHPVGAVRPPSATPTLSATPSPTPDPAAVPGPGRRDEPRGAGRPAGDGRDQLRRAGQHDRANPGGDPRGQRDPARQLDGRGGRRPGGWSAMSGTRPAGPRACATLLAVDQEGGLVQRLKGPGFDRIPAAQGPGRAVRRGADRGRAAGAVSFGRGRHRRQPGSGGRRGAGRPGLAQRADRPAGPRLRRVAAGTVAAKTSAFIDGHGPGRHRDGGQALPGPRAGCAATPTSPAGWSTDQTTRRNDPALRGFRASVDAGVDMVMVSSAYYSKIDPEHRAAFSPVIIDTLLRGDLGFDGVVISDDLSAAAMSDLDAGGAGDAVRPRRRRPGDHRRPGRGARDGRCAAAGRRGRVRSPSGCARARPGWWR